MPDKGIAVTIIIEWENVLLSEFERCRRMLEQLASQTTNIITSQSATGEHTYAPFEVLIMLNPEEVDLVVVEQAVAEYLPRVDGIGSVKIESAPGQLYYGLKNVGAERSSGEIIVFLDSDVVPDDNWLDSLLGSMQKKNMAVVGGNAYIEVNNIVDKAFAVNWFFALRQQQGGIESVNNFYANNVAFRRSVFERFKFVVDPRTARGACVDMARRLRENGFEIFRDSGAQVSHPPPNGLGHFLVRGIAQGRDALMAMRNNIKARHRANIVHALIRLLRNTIRAIRKVVARRKVVDIKWFEVPVVVLISITYQFLIFIGEFMTFLVPSYMARHFKV